MKCRFSNLSNLRISNKFYSESQVTKPKGSINSLRKANSVKIFKRKIVPTLFLNKFSQASWKEWPLEISPQRCLWTLKNQITNTNRFLSKFWINYLHLAAFNNKILLTLNIKCRTHRVKHLINFKEEVILSKTMEFSRIGSRIWIKASNMSTWMGKLFLFSVLMQVIKSQLGNSQHSSSLFWENNHLRC